MRDLHHTRKWMEVDGADHEECCCLQQASVSVFFWKTLPGFYSASAAVIASFEL